VEHVRHLAEDRHFSPKWSFLLMNGNQKNPMNWAQVAWRLTYKQQPLITVWARDLEDAIEKSGSAYYPSEALFYDGGWVACTAMGIRRSMAKLVKRRRAGGRKKAIAA
jgi:hypothetical protein